MSAFLSLPDDFISQRIGKLDGFNIAQGLPLELVGHYRGRMLFYFDRCV